MSQGWFHRHDLSVLIVILLVYLIVVESHEHDGNHRDYERG